MLGHRALTVEDYTKLLKKRGWMIVLPTVLLALVGWGITFFVPPEYVSQTLVLIQQQTVPDSFVKPVVSEDLDSRLASMKEQILSRSRLEPIINQFGLYANKKMTMDDRIDQVRKDIDIKPIHSEIARSGGLPGFFISFRASDARTAQQACGAITSLFVNENIQSRQDSAQGTTDFLASQLADAKRSLDDQDAKLADFQRQYIGRLPGEEAPNMNMLTSLNTQLDAATQQLASLQNSKSYAEAMLSAQAARETPAAEGASSQQPQVQEQQLQTLLTQEADLTSRYTDDYPDVVAVRRKIADLRAQMAKAATVKPAATPAPADANRTEPMNIVQLRASIRATDAMIAQKIRDQSQLQSAVRTYQDRISSSPMVQEQYKNITRDYQTAQGIYDNLLKQVNAAKMATDLEKRQQGEQFRVMDAPNLPEEAAYPKKPLFVGGGFVAGLALGLLIVGWIEYRDTALRSERDIWAFTKLPTLAVIAMTHESESHTKRPWFKFGGRKDDLPGKPLMDTGA